MLQMIVIIIFQNFWIIELFDFEWKKRDKKKTENWKKNIFMLTSQNIW